MNSFKLLCLFYRFRRWLAFFICSELKEKHQRNRFGMDYVEQIYRKRMKDVRGRDKAIARLQRERKDMRQEIRVLAEGWKIKNDNIRNLQHSKQEMLVEINQLQEKIKAY